MKKVLFLVASIVFFPLAGINQLDYQDNLVVRFENLTVNDRLPSHRVLCVCQDRMGFMWFGTEEGLCRYDGHQFVEFFADIKDPYSLKNHAIRSIVEDRFGNLWIGTDGGGLHYFTMTNQRFYSYSLPFQPIDNPHSQPGHIYAILGTHSGEYWIGSYGQGLYKIPAYSSPEEVIDRCENRSEEGVIQILPNGQRDGLNDLNVYCLYQDKQSDIWVGTDDYGTEEGGALHKLIQDGGHAEDFKFLTFRSDPDDRFTLGSNYIMSVYEDLQGRFWVCTWEGGLNLLDRKSGQVRQFRENDGHSGSLNSDDIYNITEDRNGNLWIATYGGGISRIQEGPDDFRFVPYLHDNHNSNTLIGDFVRKIFVDQGGLIWAITWKSGISRIRVNQNPFIQIPIPGHAYSDTLTEVVQEIRQLSDSSLVIYTEEQGFLSLKLSGENNRAVFSQLSDPLEWPDKPIFQTDFAKKYASNRAFRNLISDARVHLEDQQSNLWFAKESSLYRLVGQPDGSYSETIFERNSQDPTALKGFHITGIVQDQDANIWISTFDGLNLFDETNDSFTHFTMKDGLPGNAISAMVIDDNNFLWLATDQGLARFDARYHGVLSYGSEDGLPFSDFCNRVRYGMEDLQHVPAYTELPDGRAIFSSIQHGLLLFKPDDIFRDLTVPKTWITELHVMNKLIPAGAVSTGPGPMQGTDILFAKSLYLKPEERSFSFTVSVMDYFNPKQTQFAYRLKPANEEWLYTDTGEERISFSMLPAGDYIFEVRGANAYGIWSDSPTTMSIHVGDFWYNRLWFRLLILGLILLIVTMIVIRSRQRGQIVQALSIEKMRRQEENRFTQMRLNFYTNVTHEFRTQLTLILGPIGKIERLLPNKEIQTDLTIMKRNGLSLLNLVNQLMDFRKLESKAMHLQVENGNLTAYIRGICELFSENILSREIVFKFESLPDEIHGYFDRGAVDKIVFNLLSNAFKYTEKKGRIEVRLESYKSGEIERLKMTISDNGQGIPKELLPKVFDRFYQGDHSKPGSGIGLSIVKSLAEMHKGQVSVESRLNQGATFMIDIPLSMQAYEAVDISDRPGDTSIDLTPFRPQVVSSNGMNSSGTSGNGSPRQTVLIVEDNVDMLSFIEGIIQCKYRIQKAGNAESALKMLESREPDIVLTDLMMPGTGGMELVRILKDDIRYTHIPIIIISALENKEQELTGLELGADDFIHKPFDPDILLLKISNRLKNRLHFRQNYQRIRKDKELNEAISEQDQDFLLKLMDQINQYYSNPSFSVKDLVEKMGMSHSVLLRKVKSLTGQSINEMIVMVRLEKANELLRTGNYPVKEVAYQVGFSDPKYFSTRFKKKYGYSPSELA